MKTVITRRPTTWGTVSVPRGLKFQVEDDIADKLIARGMADLESTIKAREKAMKEAKKAREAEERKAREEAEKEAIEAQEEVTPDAGSEVDD